MDKNTLRREALVRRKKAASPALSAEICEKAFRLPYVTAARTVMLYLPTGREVDTSRLLSLLLQAGKTVCAPRIKSPTEMEAALFGETALKRGAFGIWEPTGEIVPTPDLIFVPGVVFDAEGHRIGYGKGYYDRFLERQSCPCVGLAHASQLVDHVPAEPHDRRMDLVVTERR